MTDSFVSKSKCSFFEGIIESVEIRMDSLAAIRTLNWKLHFCKNTVVNNLSVLERG